MSTKGEGSRGGHVVRHTASGIPVYEGHATRVVKQSLANAGDYKTDTPINIPDDILPDKPPENDPDRKWRIAKGIGIVAAGALGTYALSRMAGNMVRKSAHVENAGMDFLTKGRQARFLGKGSQASEEAAQLLEKKGLRTIKRSNVYYHSALHVRRLAGALGGAGIGYGSGKVVGEVDPGHHNKLEEIGGAIGGAAIGAAFPARFGFYEPLAHAEKWKARRIAIKVALHKIKKPL